MSYASRYDVVGSLHGEWFSGDTVCINGPSYVPRGKSLIIHGGAVVMPKSTDALVVRGHFEANGTEYNPIILEPIEDWMGFRFVEDSLEFQNISFMIMDDESETASIPNYVIVTQDSWLRLYNCIFRAKTSCVVATHGRLQAVGNRFKSTDVFSSTVFIDFLANGLQDPCHNPEGNTLHSNIIKASIPAGVLAPPNPGYVRFTTALYINGSTDLCLFGNVISASAPSFCIGAYFGETVEIGTPTNTLDSCVIAVQGRNGPACAVMNANDGDLQVVACTIDAAIPLNTIYGRIGIFASGTARVDVSNSIVQVDAGDNYFVGESGGFLTVRYTDKWTIPPSGDNSFEPVNPDEVSIDFSDDPTLNVIEGDGVISVDPMFRSVGNWGEWLNFLQAADFYSLLPTSGCIDNGDPTLGFDPDGSRRDIGCFYFDQNTNDVPDKPIIPISTVALAPAYPNPFNASTTIPFTLERSGKVSIKLYDMLGREAGNILAGNQSKGFHQVNFTSDGLPSGVYIVALNLDGEFIAKQKLVLLK